MTNEQKLREISYKWGITWEADESGYRHAENRRNELLSDLTALLEEHYYPKEYLMWIFKGCPFLIGENGAGKIIAFSVRDGKQYTPDELYQYWKENVK